MLIVLAAAGLLFAQAAAAPPTPSSAATPPAAQAKAEKPKKPKLICTEETSVSSFIPKRVCRTPEQIEAERVAGRRDTDAVQDRLRSCQGPSC